MNAAVECAAVRPLSPPWLVMAGKEIRENLKWGLLGLIVVSLVLAYTTNTAKGQMSTSWTVIEYWRNVNKALLETAPLLGVLLGLLQTIPEKRRDLWAFLIHRPASRASLFLGKTAAGLGLYAAVMTIPFLGIILWAAAPGNLPAPFVWGLTLAGWGAILAGVSFYFATMLTVLRPGLWYGRKLLPIMAALPLLMLLIPDVPFAFPVSAGVMTLYAAAFAAAARKAFQTDGEFQDGASIGRFGLGMLLFTGSSAVFLLAIVISIAVKGSIDRDAAQEYTSQYYGLRQSGELLRIKDHNGDLKFTGIRTPDGRPENRPLGKDATAGYYTPWSFVSPLPLNANAGFTSPEKIVQFTETQNMPRSDQFWYYVPALGQFMGYSSTLNAVDANRLGSTIGPNGLTSNHAGSVVADPGRFSDPVWSIGLGHGVGTILVTETAAYQIGADANPVRRISLPPGIGKITGVTDLTGNSISNSPPSNKPVKGSDPAAAVATAHGFTILSQGGYALGSIPREFDAATYPIVSVMWPQSAGLQSANQPARIYVWYQSGNDTQIRVWTAGGSKIASYAIPADHDPMVNIMPGKLFLPAVVPVSLWVWSTSQHMGAAGWKQLLSFFFTDEHDKLYYALIILCCPLLGWLIAHRCHLPIRTRIAWTLALVLLGIPGVLTMLALYTWPTLVRCPNCSRKRTVDAENCSHCKSPFPAPSPTGTEIFDDQSASRLPSGVTGSSGKQEVAA